MNKKAQFGTIAIFFEVLLAMFFLGSGFAEQITYWTQLSIVNNGLTGLTAFLLAYMNLWIVLGLMMVVSISSSILQGNNQ